MSRIALFPGTFDPVTLGHVDIINRSLKLFDTVYVGVGRNTAKQPMFSEEKRINWLEEIFRLNDRVKIVSYEGLTIDCCRSVGAGFILRGIRNGQDLEYEKSIADANRLAAPEIESVFMTCLPQYSTIASTLVRDMIKYGGNIKGYLPIEVINGL